MGRVTCSNWLPAKSECVRCEGRKVLWCIVAIPVMDNEERAVKGF